MIPDRDRCPTCARPLITSRFDATFRMPDQSERLCFAIPGGLCDRCHQLYIDPDLLELLELFDGRCTFAIETDLVQQANATTSGVWRGHRELGARLPDAG